MFRSLAFSAALLLCGPFASLICAQSATNHAFNRGVSSQDKAEAKRLYKEGVKYGESGLFAQAVELLNRSTKLDPGNADAHFALGHAYYDLKNGAMRSRVSKLQLRSTQVTMRRAIGSVSRVRCFGRRSQKESPPNDVQRHRNPQLNK